MNRSELLDEAKRLTMTDREKDYGDCVRTHGEIAAMWSVILGLEVKAAEVALCMVALKMVRAKSSPEKADHYADGAAYMAIAGECALGR